MIDGPAGQLAVRTKGMAGAPKQIVVLSRKKTATRRWVNEDACVLALRAAFPNERIVVYPDSGLPSDEMVLIERFFDEVGDWCVCVQSPSGKAVHAPWATAVQGVLRRELGLDAQTAWTDDGMIFRLPETDEAAVRAWTRTDFTAGDDVLRLEWPRIPDLAAAELPNWRPSDRILPGRVTVVDGHVVWTTAEAMHVFTNE